MRGGRVWELSLSEHRVTLPRDHVSLDVLLRAHEGGLPHRAAVTLRTGEAPPAELSSQRELHAQLQPVPTGG